MKMYELRTRKQSENNWCAELWQETSNANLEYWEFVDVVCSDSYQGLQAEIGNAGFFDKLNK